MIDQNIGEINPPATIQFKGQIEYALSILSSSSPSNFDIGKGNKVIMDNLNNKNFLDTLLQMLVQYEESELQSSLLLSWISTYINHQLKHGINIVRHKKYDIYSKLKSAFLVPNISRKHKNILQKSFVKFIHTLSSQFIKIREDLCNTIVDFVKQWKFEFSQMNVVENYFHLMRTLLHQSSLQTQTLSYFLQNLLMEFLKFCENGMVFISKEIESGQQQNINEGQLQDFVKVVSITRLLLNKTKAQNNPLLLDECITSNTFYSFCMKTICLKIKNQGGLLIKDNQRRFQKINKIKEEVFNMIKYAIQRLSKNEKNLKNSKYDQLLYLSKHILQEISILIIHDIKYFPSQSLPPLSQECLVQALFCIQKIIRISLFFQIAYRMRDIILFDICFRCLRPQQEDLNLPPLQYLQKKQNLIKLDTIKGVNEASQKILESYVDKVDGSISYIYRTCINLMDFQLTATPQYFQNLPHYFQNCEFYTNLRYEQQIQSCLLILASLSYISQTRIDVAIQVEAFIIRRQQFFSRIDIPPQVIAAFYICYSYYQDTFYDFIIQGRSNYVFHRALLFHSHQLMKYVFDQHHKKFKQGFIQVISLQIKDFFSSAITQEKWLEAIFPLTDINSETLLVKFFENFQIYIDNQINLDIIEDIWLQFVKNIVRRNFNDKEMKYEKLRDSLGLMFGRIICQNLYKNLCNGWIIKTKLLQMLKMVMLLSKNATNILHVSIQHLEMLALKQMNNTSDIVQLLTYFMRRSLKEGFLVPSQLLIRISNIALAVVTFVDDDCFCFLFQLLVDLNLRQINALETLSKLISLFSEREEERQTDPQVQPILSKILYLIIQIQTVSYHRISLSQWQKVLHIMIQFLSHNYIKQNSALTGKATVISFIIYQSNPKLVQEYLGHKINGLWDCVFDNCLQFSCTTQKRIMVIKMLETISLPITELMKSKIPLLLKESISIIYYLYEKPKIEWCMENDDDSEQNDSESKKQCWEQETHNIHHNQFIKMIPNELILMRDVCQNLNKGDSDSFRKFVSELPISLQNMVKNKLYFYSSSNGLSLKTILKIKKINE